MKTTAWRPGFLFRAVRFTGRLFYPALLSAPAPSEPCVLICRHGNLLGPALTMLWMDGPVRPWVLDVFCDAAPCERHYRGYTLTRRLGWPGILAAPCAFVLARLVPRFMRSMGAIPVSRHSARSLVTLRRSVLALQSGQSVILYPDIEYDQRARDVGALYDGYLLMARLYRKKTGRALTFVPVSVKGRRLRVGEGIKMDEGEDRRAASKRVGQTLHNLEDQRISLKHAKGVF